MKKVLPIVFILILISILYVYTRPKIGTQNATVSTEAITPTENSVQATSPVSLEPTNIEMYITILSPINGAIVKTSDVAIVGKTKPNAEVFINDSQSRANSNGNFSLSITLEEGENYIFIAANDAFGNYKETELTVIYEAN